MNANASNAPHLHRASDQDTTCNGPPESIYLFSELEPSSQPLPHVPDQFDIFNALPRPATSWGRQTYIPLRLEESIRQRPKSYLWGHNRETMELGLLINVVVRDGDEGQQDDRPTEVRSTQDTCL